LFCCWRCWDFCFSCTLWPWSICSICIPRDVSNSWLGYHSSSAINIHFIITYSQAPIKNRTSVEIATFPLGNDLHFCIHPALVALCGLGQFVQYAYQGMCQILGWVIIRVVRSTFTSSSRIVKHRSRIALRLKLPHILLVMICIFAYIPSISAVGTDATAAVGINIVSTTILTSPSCVHQNKKQRLGNTAHTTDNVITLQDLNSQIFSGVPNDWETKDLYHPVCVKLWRAYLVYRKVYIDLCPIEGSKFHEVYPHLPWHLPRDKPVVFLLMNYLTSNLANAMSNGLHPANARRTNNTLRSCCWELIRLP
jgi:hypothetical protein